jgi:hypothetical protein
MAESLQIRRAMSLNVLRIAIASAAVSILAATCADAQTAPPPKPPDQTQASPQKPEPPANIPLFPRYRRGLYKNGTGLWVIDGPPQSPPLFNDDPGVPDKGTYEINFTTRADLRSSIKSYDFLHVDANYGLEAHLFGHDLPMQLKLEGPISGVRESGQPIVAGAGAFETGLKINFYSNDDQGVDLSIYPQLAFGAGSTAVDKGLVEPGQTFDLPLLISKQFHFVTLIFNTGIETPINDPERTTEGTAGAAIGFVVRRHLALMGEVRFESPFNGQEKATTILNAGVMTSLGHYAVLYGNVGRTLSSPDDETHVFVGIGVKIMIVPERKK